MRRKDKEVTSAKEIAAILQECDVCRLGFYDGTEPYIVPMNFGYEYDQKNGALTLYFHSANAGRKLDILAENPNICFEMDCRHVLLSEDKACDCSMDYASLMGTGTVRFAGTDEEKIHGLNQLMKKYAGRAPEHYDMRVFARTAVLIVTAKTLSAKASGQNR